MPGLGFTEDVWVAVEFSTTAILMVLVMAVVMVAVPVWIGRRRLRGCMVVGGSNSLVISAACHASTVGLSEPAGSPSNSMGNVEAEPQTLLSPSGKIADGEYNSASHEELVIRSSSRKAALLRLSRMRLRWGAVKMPPTFQEQCGDMQECVGHLSFGSTEQDAGEARDGCYYA